MNKYIIERLVSWAEGKPSPPLKLEMWIPSTCNLKCKFCNRWKSKKVDEIEEELIMKILKDAKNMDVRDFVISGYGEPFTRVSLLKKIFKKVKEYNLDGCIVTNGNLLENKDLKFLVDIGWNSIFFSLESCDESSHDSIVGMSGAFKKLIKAISNLDKIKKKLGKEQPIIHINVVLAEWNFKEVKNFIRLAKWSGVNKIDFQSLMNMKQDWNQKKFENFKVEIFKAVNLSKEFDIETNLTHFINIDYIKYANEVEKIFLEDTKNKEGFLSIPCYLPWYGIMITHDGKVGPCAQLAERSNIDIFSHTLKEIWFDAFDSFRKDMVNNKIKGCMCCTPMVIENRMIRKELQNVLKKAES